MSSQRDAVGQDTMIADKAVVRDVDVGHQQIVRTDHRFSRRGGTTIDRDILPDGRMIADLSSGLFACELQVLRDRGNNSAWEYSNMLSDPCTRENGDVASDPGALTDLDILVDDGERIDLNILADLRLRVDPIQCLHRLRLDGSGFVSWPVHFFLSRRTICAIISDSITTLSPTKAFPRI